MTKTWRVWWALLAAAWWAPAALAADAGSVSNAEAGAVRAVVQAQLEAFAADDAGRAFALAAPKIREMFGSADRFMAMVRTNYPVVYRPASVEFLLPTRIEGELVQAVRFSDGRGALWLALYRMERQADKSWRIAGCEVAEVEGRTT